MSDKVYVTVKSDVTLESIADALLADYGVEDRIKVAASIVPECRVFAARTMENAPRDRPILAWFPPRPYEEEGTWWIISWHAGAWYHPFYVEPECWVELPPAPGTRTDQEG